jgi:hypothetical protein
LFPFDKVDEFDEKNIYVICLNILKTYSSQYKKLSNIFEKSKNILSNINTISYNNNSNNYIHNFRTNNSNKTNHINTFPNEEEFFNYSSNKIQELSKEEKLIFGDRIMKGYTKQKLLGKGGCGIVWLCTKLGSQIFDDGGNIKKRICC